MNTYKKIGLLVGISFLFSSGYAAYLENVPQKITQPDGTVIHCFASGDEFHNWLHDSAGFTIMQHPQTGYYVYAELSGEDLVASQYVVGKVNPADVGLYPKMNISPQAWKAKRDAFFPPDIDPPPVTHKAKNQGRINNLVVFISFDDDDAGFSSSFGRMDSTFNDSSSLESNSMYNFYKLASYGQMHILSHFYPEPSGDTILSYKDYNPRSYYLPYNAATNPNGFTGGENGQQRIDREQTLLENAINYVEASIPSNIDFDYNGDWNIDNVCFIITGTAVAGGGILWPHRWYLFRTVMINTKKVWDYNINLEYMSVAGSSTIVGVVTHEMMHTLSAPDLYHSKSGYSEPIGDWDLMASTNYSCPQGLGAYVKYKYGGWINNIPQISQPGTYTLYPANGNSPNKTAYIIYPDPYYHNNEFFVLEYRSTASNVFENGLPGSGILIYRIDDSYTGNNGYNGTTILDELYIFRPTISDKESLSQAHFAAGVNRTEFGLYTNPSPFYSRGGVINNVQITNITAAGDSIQFTVGFEELPVINPNPLILDCTFDYRTSFFIGANANETWTVSNMPPWAQIAKDTIGKGNKTVSIRTLEAYSGTEPRAARLLIKSNSLNDTLTVIQCPCGMDAAACKQWVLGVQETNQNAGIKIFPNPAQSQITVTNAQNADLRLYNILGQEVLHAYSYQENAVININSLPQGIYVLKVLKDGGLSVHKIVVGG